MSRRSTAGAEPISFKTLAKKVAQELDTAMVSPQSSGKFRKVFDNPNAIEPTSSTLQRITHRYQGSRPLRAPPCRKRVLGPRP